MAKQNASLTPGRFAYQGLERALHEKARLGIMTFAGHAPPRACCSAN